MSMKDITIVAGVVAGFCCLLEIVFLALKIAGVIDWGWGWVISPLWIALATVPVIIVDIVMTVTDNEKK